MGTGKVKLCHKKWVAQPCLHPRLIFWLVQDRYILDIEIGIVRLAQGLSVIICRVLTKKPLHNLTLPLD